MRTKHMERLNALEKGDDREWLTAVGEALFGARWQRPLAEALGLSSGYVSRLMSDSATRLEMSDALRDRLASFSDTELPRRQEAWLWQAALLSASAERFRRHKA